MRYASNCARDLIATNSRSLLIASACFVVGTAIGVAVAVKIEDYSALNLLEALKLGEYSASGAFFKCLALGVIGAALAYLTAFKRQLAAVRTVVGLSRLPFRHARGRLVQYGARDGDCIADLVLHTCRGRGNISYRVYNRRHIGMQTCQKRRDDLPQTARRRIDQNRDIACNLCACLDCFLRHFAKVDCNSFPLSMQKRRTLACTAL